MMMAFASVLIKSTPKITNKLKSYMIKVTEKVSGCSVVGGWFSQSPCRFSTSRVLNWNIVFIDISADES